MLKVTIVSPTAKVISWGAKPGREAGSMRTQEAWFHTIARDGTAAPFPEKVEVVLDREKRDSDNRLVEPEQQPYGAGEYTLHPSAIYIDRNGRLALTPRLTPMAKRSA